MPVDLSKTDDKQLLALQEAYLDQLGTFLATNAPFWGSKMGIRSGTLTNLEQGLAYMATLGNSGLEVGCVSLQNQTERALSSAGADGWIVEKIRVGSLVMGHSAVAVYPKGKGMHQGYVFDPWLSQAPLIYDFQEWEGHFKLMSLMGGARSQ